MKDKKGIIDILEDGEMTSEKARTLLEEMTGSYVAVLRMIMPYFPAAKGCSPIDLTFFKTIMEFEQTEGFPSRYFLQVSHLEGPKLSLDPNPAMKVGLTKEELAKELDSAMHRLDECAAYMKEDFPAEAGSVTQMVKKYKEKQDDRTD